MAASAQRIEDRVVTLAVLERQWPESGSLVVRRDAVVTPAVRDELRRRKMTLVRESTSSASANGESLALIELGTQTGRIANGIGVAFDRVTGRDLADAIRLAKEQIERRRLTVLATEQAAAAVCFANRHPEIRAANGNTLAAVKEAVKSIAANVLVIDPSKPTIYELKNLLREFARGGWRDLNSA